jgi:hypothetical protein
MKSRLSTAVLVVFWAASCGAPPPPKGRADLFAFLMDGRTRKEQVLDRLGQPSGSFDDGRTLTYRVGYEPATKGYFVVEREEGASGWPTWLEAKYSLVVVFDGSGRLRKHSLMEVN